jgi:hypothetical protein
MGARFILTHEAAESDHIGMQDRGKLPLSRGSFLRRLSRVFELGSASLRSAPKDRFGSITDL